MTYKGVNFLPPRGKWRATIYYNGGQHHLGFFNTKHEAALAYNLEAIKHGKPLNKIDLADVPKEFAIEYYQLITIKE